MSQDFWILTFIDLYIMSYCVLICVLYRKESANKRYRNSVNNLILPYTVSQNDEKPHTAELDDTSIPHVKIKITETSPIPQYRKPPCPPPCSLQLDFHWSSVFASRLRTRVFSVLFSFVNWILSGSWSRHRVIFSKLISEPACSSQVDLHWASPHLPWGM